MRLPSLPLKFQHPLEWRDGVELLGRHVTIEVAEVALGIQLALLLVEYLFYASSVLPTQTCIFNFSQSYHTDAAPALPNFYF